MPSYFGKYRGIVENNLDPMQIGRIQARVPLVAPLPLTWALPCSPYAGDCVGLVAIPPVGANVWIEFEGGNMDYPIWTGCFWGAAGAPDIRPETKILKTRACTITISDVTEEVTIEAHSGARMSIGPSSVEISNGQGASVKLVGSEVFVEGDCKRVIETQ